MGQRDSYILRGPNSDPVACGWLTARGFLSHVNLDFVGQADFRGTGRGQHAGQCGKRRDGHRGGLREREIYVGQADLRGTGRGRTKERTTGTQSRRKTRGGDHSSHSIASSSEASVVIYSNKCFSRLAMDISRRRTDLRDPSSCFTLYCF